MAEPAEPQLPQPAQLAQSAKTAKKRPKKRRMLCQTRSRQFWELCEYGCQYHPGRRLMMAERYAAAKRSGLTGDELAAYRHCPCIEFDFETTQTISHCPAWQIRDGKRIYPPPPPPPNRVPDFVYLGVDEETEQRIQQQEKQVLLHNCSDPDFVQKNRLVPYAIYTTVHIHRPRVRLTLAKETDMIRVVMVQDFESDSMQYLYLEDDEQVQGITYDVDRLVKTTKVVIYEVERKSMYSPKEYKLVQEINGDAKLTAQKLGYIKSD